MTLLAYRRRSKQAGFTIVEALVALLVMSFGMLALAGLQLAMTRSADLAKQRSEAVRLAQLKMEQLRSYDGITSGSYTYGTNVVSSTAAETICPTCTAPLNATTNATFTRNWTVTRADGVTAADSDDLQKWIRVAVTWTDRANQTQTVTLNSVIARNDPIALAGMVGGQARARTRYPKNRNVNVPYPAVTLSGGKTSAFVPPPGNTAYVFDNANANIKQQCTATAFPISLMTRTGGTVTVFASGHSFPVGAQVAITGTPDPSFHGTFRVTSVEAGVSFTYATNVSTTATATGGSATRVLALTEGMTLASGGGITCTDVNAYLISGYVRFKTSSPSPTAANIENTTDPTLPLASAPLVIDSSTTGNGPSAVACFAQSEKVVAADNAQPSTISTASRSGDVVTVTTSGVHGFAVGQYVAIEETGNFAFNGSFRVTSVPSSSTFTYVQSGIDASTSGGRATLIQQVRVPENASTPGYSATLSVFIAYSCIVNVVSDGTAMAWWGELKLVPASSWALGTTSSTYKVCRFTGDYYDDNVASNSEHPRYYRRVKATLDNQNFLVIRGNDDCPTDVASNPVAGDYVNTSTVQHQPPVSGSNGSLSFECLTASCTGSDRVTIEPSSTATAVQMVCPANVDGCT